MTPVQTRVPDAVAGDARLSADSDPGAHAGFRPPWNAGGVTAANYVRVEHETSERITDSPDSAGSAITHQSPMLEISNAMVGLYKEVIGRGPTKARAQFVGQDTLLVTLESSLTVAERNLAAMGEHRRLREARLFLSYTLEDQFRTIVEQALGRKTLAFATGIDTTRDVTIKLFTLELAANATRLRQAQPDAGATYYA